MALLPTEIQHGKGPGMGVAGEVLQAATLATALFGVALLAWMWACR